MSAQPPPEGSSSYQPKGISFPSGRPVTIPTIASADRMTLCLTQYKSALSHPLPYASSALGKLEDIASTPLTSSSSSAAPVSIDDIQEFQMPPQVGPAVTAEDQKESRARAMHLFLVRNELTIQAAVKEGIPAHEVVQVLANDWGNTRLAMIDKCERDSTFAKLYRNVDNRMQQIAALMGAPHSYHVPSNELSPIKCMKSRRDANMDLAIEMVRNAANEYTLKLNAACALHKEGVAIDAMFSILHHARTNGSKLAADALSTVTEMLTVRASNADMLKFLRTRYREYCEHEKIDPNDPPIAYQPITLNHYMYSAGVELTRKVTRDKAAAALAKLASAADEMADK